LVIRHKKRSPGVAGFTLLELLVVLAIGGLLFTLVPSMISAAVPGAKLNIASRELASTLRESRNKAVSRGSKVDVFINPQAPQYAIENAEPHDFPASVSVDAQVIADINSTATTSPANLGMEDRFRVRFYPDGSSSGAVITLRQEQLAYTIDVSWLLGSVSISRSAGNDN
jgi:general secretion pathway protein H